MVDSDITIRRATDDDLERIVEVGAAALGWKPGEPNEDLFRWKHLENPFGTSPIWVAEEGDRLAGYRAFMRWEFDGPDGRRWRAVRAVDTATHPDFQRRGIFRQLTMQGVEEMTAEGVDIVFNTPNIRSRPGYLKLGWRDVGRLPVAARPTGLRSVARLRGARAAAEKWSEESATGAPAVEVLADDALGSLVAPDTGGLSTPWTLELLRWRYRLEPLRYRVWVPDGVDGGVVFFRVRRRGTARECSVASVLTPVGDAARGRRLLAGLAASVDAEYLLCIGASDLRHGFIAVPRQGPRLTTRALASEPPKGMGEWSLQLGDVELF